jgi:hypothetical protein
VVRTDCPYLNLNLSLMPFTPHVWDDGTKGTYGDGISRPAAGANTQRYVVLVRMPHCAPVRVSTMAENSEAARRYMQARWPEATVEVVA